MSLLKSCLRSGVLLSTALAGLAAAQQPDTKPHNASGPSKPHVSSIEDYDRVLKASEQYAKTVSGQDDYQYATALDYALRGAVKGPDAEASGTNALALPSVMKGTRTLSTARWNAEIKNSQRESMLSDPTWLKNWEILNHSNLAQPEARIWGGVPVSAGAFPDCVAVGAANGFCCSGTLIGKNVVVTAAHCVAGECDFRIFIGDNSNLTNKGKVFSVKKAVAHENYDDQTNRNDIAILILESDVTNVTPRRIVSTADADAATSLRAVGFGVTQTGVFGVKSMVDVAVATCDCASPAAQGKYGCHGGLEAVAGGNGYDSCNGDSGGPYYLVKGQDLFLVGATSRATKGHTGCGDGGISTRVDKYLDWIRQTATREGGDVP
jgi:hypothetical protein